MSGYTVFNDNLQAKELIVGNGERRNRYILCYNPKGAKRQREHRQAVVALLEAELGSHPNTSAKAQWAIELLASHCLKRYVRVTKDNQIRIDRMAIREAAKYDGKWVLKTNDDTLHLADVQNLLKVLQNLVDAGNTVAGLSTMSKSSRLPIILSTWDRMAATAAAKSFLPAHRLTCWPALPALIRLVFWKNILPTGHGHSKYGQSRLTPASTGFHDDIKERIYMIATLPPAQIGMSLAEIDTPALLIDLEAFEHNLTKMQQDLSGGSVYLRPHAKTHKCPLIARQQLDRGAVGVCCQKVGEAEAMVYGGIPDVFITNEVVGVPKLRRMAALARQARIAVCADDPAHISAYEIAAKEGGVRLDVFIELDVGAHRCGLESGEKLLMLVRQIEASPHLHFAGLQAYHGSAQHRRTPSERRDAIESAVGCVREAKALLDRHGFDCPTVSGAGTGTYLIEAGSGVYNELQAGSYIFMDVDYAKNLDENGRPLDRFRHSLFVYTTVISRPVPDRAVVDAGHKAVPLDSGLPVVAGMTEVEYVRASDEHGKLTLQNPAVGLSIGDKLKLIPGHCDPTVNLFDWFVGIRTNRVETLWPITARGAMR